MKTTNIFRSAAAAVMTAAMALTGCVQSAPEAPTATVDWDNAKFNVTVEIADAGGTRAAKTNWAEDDTIVAFFGGADDKYAVLRYDGSEWARVSVAPPSAANGTLTALHAGGGAGFNLSSGTMEGIAGELLYTAGEAGNSYAYDSGSNAVSITLTLARLGNIIRVQSTEDAAENAKWRLAATNLKHLTNATLSAATFVGGATAALEGLYGDTDPTDQAKYAKPEAKFTDGTEAVFFVLHSDASNMNLWMYKVGAENKRYERSAELLPIAAGKAVSIPGPTNAPLVWDERTVFVPVESITDVPTAATKDVDLPLTGTVNPGGATNKTIVWSVASGNALAGVTVNEGVFKATTAGTATVTATITNGTSASPATDYTEDFEIVVGDVVVNSVADLQTALDNSNSTEEIVLSAPLTTDAVLTLSNSSSTSNVVTITIPEADGNSVTIKEPESSTTLPNLVANINNAENVTIDAPSLSVDFDGTVTGTLTAETAENTLTILADAEVNKLVVVGGNVVVLGTVSSYGAIAEESKVIFPVATADEFLAARAKLPLTNGVIQLTENISYSGDNYLTIFQNQNVTIDLNGKDITRTQDVAFLIYCIGKLTINGEGEVFNPYGNAVAVGDGGEVVINSGTYNTGDSETIYAYGDPANLSAVRGTITINGGYFKATQTFDPDKGDNRWFVLNLKDNSGAKIEVKGGTFYNYNPAASLTEPGYTTTPWNFVAEGYQSAETGEGTNIWVVSKVE